MGFACCVVSGPGSGGQLLDLANLFTSSIVVARVPLALSGSDTSRDICLVREDSSQNLELPVRVVHDSGDQLCLSMVEIIDSGVNVVTVVDTGLHFGCELDDEGLDLLEVLSLEGSNHFIGLVGKGLVLAEASPHVALDIDAEVAEEETGLEVSRCSGRDGGVDLTVAIGLARVGESSAGAGEGDGDGLSGVEDDGRIGRLGLTSVRLDHDLEDVALLDARNGVSDVHALGLVDVVGGALGRVLAEEEVPQEEVHPEASIIGDADTAGLDGRSGGRDGSEKSASKSFHSKY